MIGLGVPSIRPNNQVVVRPDHPGRGVSTERSMMAGRVFLVLTGACQFGQGVGGMATKIISFIRLLAGGSWQPLDWQHAPASPRALRQPRPMEHTAQLN